jgi:hypothetical protein
VFILIFPAATVRAQTIVFDNFGPGDTYNTSSSFLCANDGDWQSAWAFQFVPTSSGYVSDIWLPVNLFDGGTANNLEIALMTDSGNDQPGVVLETWTFNVSKKTYSGSIVQGIGTGTKAISEGVKYWLAGTVPSGTTSVVEWYSTPNDETENFILKESIGFTDWGSPWVGSRAAFRIAVSDCDCYEVTYTNADNPEDAKVEPTNVCFNFEEHAGIFGMWNLSLFFDSMNKQALAYGISAGVPVAYLKFHGDQVHVVTGIYNFYGNQWTIRGHKISSENCHS